MTGALNQLDVSVRDAVHQLEEINFISPEVLFLLGTGVEDLQQALDEPTEISLSELSDCPQAWKASTLHSGRIRGVRIWAITDSPDPDNIPWARAWPVWLARRAGAGACMVTAAGSQLHEEEGKEGTDGYLFVSDHIIFDGSSTLRGLANSNLGPLFPDQGNVHDAGLRAELLKTASAMGLPSSEGVIACPPGPTLETPAERIYYSRAGAHASAPDLGPIFHAMAHSGLGGLSLLALIGNADASVEELLQKSNALAPGLADIIQSAIDPLATRARREQQEEL